ncbi:hypothetical protein HNV11_04610 [Spirosoma taeanense]|uniref:Glycosyltransferase (GlcNAc) n=1 Tax=Spirosoma taeanense TaxID=2735870 RepID=A0A6M5Y4H7_9BACT|nr:GlcNAc-transferase family protein [Spirosoma taeanense]QJW88709.1 hypothetical protein HNV11_04610 [Spirosoma taeanense]
MADIYVQIPAYRDSELPKTLRSLLAMATQAGRLRIGVFWQRAATDRLPRTLLNHSLIEITDIPYWQSKGCNWARSLLQQGWQGEPYTLLIDSHQRFVRGWDQLMIDQYEELRRIGVEKPILTGYLPPYNPVNEPHGRLHKPMEMYALRHDNGLLTKLVSYPMPFWKRLEQPKPAHFVSLHFLFTAGQFNREITFDPDIYFFGDEVVTSLRAYTNGYDLFHPHRVLGWHAYDRRTRTPHWNDHTAWSEQERISSERIRALYSGHLTGPYGPGSVRSINQYESYIYQNLISHESAA